MLSWFRELVAASGFARLGVVKSLLIVLGLPVFAGLFIQESTGIPAFAVSVSIGALALELEVLSTKAKQRRKIVSRVWPEVLDSLISASNAGMSFPEAFQDLANIGPEALRPQLKAVVRQLDSGRSLEQSLAQLQSELSEVNVDRLVTLIALVNDAGGRGFYDALRQQARIARDDLALWGELESKQGWVTGTAKVAIAAPWIIVTLLCSRAENVAAYASAGGSFILLAGLVVSAFAYQLIRMIAGAQHQPRVFSQ